MNLPRLIPIGCMCLLLTACSQTSSTSPSTPGSPTPKGSSAGLKEQIVGTWQETKGADGEEMEFTKDGALIVSMGPIKIKGKYTVEGDSTIVAHMDDPFEAGKSNSVKMKTSLAKDELTLTNDEEKDETRKVKKFKRK